MAHSITWDETKPDLTSKAYLGQQEIRNTETAARERMATEHKADASESGNSGKYWAHLPTAARVNFGTAAVRPTATDGIKGMLYYATNTTTLSYNKSSTWVTLTIFGHDTSDYRYTTGTVTVTNGSAVVTGATTTWTGNIAAGDSFKINSNALWYSISSVDSNAKLTLSANYGGATGAGKAYTVEEDRHIAYVKASGDSMNGVLSMQSHKITGLSNGTTSGDALSIGQIDNSTIKYNASNKLYASIWVHNGTLVFNSTAPIAYTDLDLSGQIGANTAFAFLKVKNLNATRRLFQFRRKGDTESVGQGTEDFPGGTTYAALEDNRIAYMGVEANSSGVVQWMGSAATSTQITLSGYIKGA